MRSVEYARAKGREARQEIGTSPADLLARLQAHLQNVYRVSLVAMRGAHAHPYGNVANGQRTGAMHAGSAVRHSAAIARKAMPPGTTASTNTHPQRNAHHGP
jgi:hypothetical protein